MTIVDCTVRPCTTHSDMTAWLPSGHTAGCPIGDPPYTIEVDDCQWCIASDALDAALDACPSCCAWCAYEDVCCRYGIRNFEDGGRVAHLRFDQDVTVRTNSGAEVTIKQGEHHPAKYVDDYDHAADLGGLVGFDMSDSGAEQYRTAWWRIRVEWVDTSVVHIPHAYVDDAAVSYLGTWTDQHDRRYA